MTDSERPGFATRCLHAGQEPDPATGARAPPIYQTTSYVFPDAATAAARFSLEDDGNIYSRFSNPTTAMLEARLASLEGGSAALATSAGMAALDAATTTLARPGDNIVSAASIYGGTHSYFSNTAGNRGIEPRFVPTLDYDAYAEAIDEDTAYVHVESISNPALVTPDLARIAEIAHERGAPLFVDNTFATPYLCNPFDHGADLIWHSTTKWLHGSGTTVGGALIAGGEFDWHDYPEVGQPNPAFHGTNFAERFGDRALVETARHRAVRSTGSGQSPFNAWVTLQGIETLPLRMERHCENAQAVAEFLADHPGVEWVTYPGLPDHETHDNASKYLSGGYGGMIAFGPKGGYDAAKGVCERTDLASFLANVGDAKTLLIHPASTTHAQLTEEEQLESGVLPDLIRLSVGIEDVDDIIADLAEALP